MPPPAYAHRYLWKEPIFRAHETPPVNTRRLIISYVMVSIPVKICSSLVLIPILRMLMPGISPMLLLKLMCIYAGTFVKYDVRTPFFAVLFSMVDCEN